MGILTPDQDYLRYDPLRPVSMKDADPLGKAAGKRVRQYDKDLGFAVHPEEKEAALTYRKNINESVNTQQANLNTYKTDFNTSLEGADTQAQGLLGQFDKLPGQETIEIEVIGGPEDSEKRTYRVNKDWAFDYLPNKYGKAGFKEDKNGVYTVNGYHAGDGEFSEGGETEAVEDKRLTKILAEVQRQTVGIDKDYETNISEAKGLASTEIDSQRGIATKSYDQNVTQAEAMIEQTKKQWTTYLKQQQDAFTEGVKTNTGGIRDLVESGALVLTGSVK